MLLSDSMISKALEWLLSIQNADGGWGADKSIRSSIEETALATDALASILNSMNSLSENNLKVNLPVEQINSQALRGTFWLLENTANINQLTSSPIGLYFAKLWYYEELYPVIFTLSALEKIEKLTT